MLKPKKGIIGGAVAAVVVVSAIFGGSGGDGEVNIPPEESSSIVQPSESIQPSIDISIEDVVQSPSQRERSEQPEPVQSPKIQTTTQKPAENKQQVFVGSTESDKYHFPSCRWAKNIKDENLIRFDTITNAKNAGYSACGTCNPR